MIAPDCANASRRKQMAEFSINTASVGNQQVVRALLGEILDRGRARETGRASENSATRPGTKPGTRRRLACRRADASLDGVALFDIVPTSVTDLLRASVLPLRAIWHNTDIPNSWRRIDRIGRPIFP